MHIRALLPVRPRPALLPAGLVATMLALSACAGDQAPAAAAAGAAPDQVFARGLAEISDLYIEPVSSRRVALSGMTRLASLDNKIGVSDSFGLGVGGALSVSYDGRDVAMLPLPRDSDSAQWGETVARVIATAKQVSPRVAAAPEEAIDKAVFDGMTASLDRFSRYLAPAVARDQRAAREGFGGIGITFDSTNDLFRVTAVTPDGPADRAGIHIDDRILAIDGVPTAGRAHEEVVHQLRGPVGSAIGVRLQRAGQVQAQDLRLQRALVVIPTVTMWRDGSIVVFRITSFNHSTTQRVAQGLKEVMHQSGGKLGGIVLDLRSNPGGLLDQAVSLADLFIDHGPIIATTGRHPASRQYFGATGGSIAPHTPIAVLINGGSASAAEIVAAALQDAGRAVVIGSSSYGKGSVQTVLKLPNGGDLILTWARLVSPSGYLLQRHGVVPTVCTADLGDDARSLETGLQRAGGAAAGSSQKARAGLDDAGWSALRQACPANQGRPAVDLTLAQRLLGDTRLYSEALHVLPAAARIAQTAAAGGSPDLTLTGGNGALFSRSR